MKIDRINYQKTFNLGNYTSERIGAEGQLDEGDSPELTLIILKDLVEKLHKDNNPQLTDASTIEWPIPVEDRSVQGPRVDAIISDINSCTELKVLETYRLMAKMSPQLQEAYETKLQSLNK